MNFLQKEQERYSKEKTAEYYLKNKEAIKEKSKNQYKSLSKKDKIKEYKKTDTRNQFCRKTRHHKVNKLCFCCV